MNPRKLLGAGIIVAVLAIVAGAYLAFHPYQAHPDHNPTLGDHPLAGLAFADEEGGSILPGSNSKVEVYASLSREATSSVVLIRLSIAKGWHVNANPPSLGFLIPTAVKIKIAGHDVAFKMDKYPQGEPSDIRLDHTDVRVYSNGTMLRASLPPSTLKLARAAGSLTVIVQVQACSSRGICLPPAHVRSIIPIPTPPAHSSVDTNGI